MRQSRPMARPAERPTEFIPRLDDTDIIPRVDDWDDPAPTALDTPLPTDPPDDGPPPRDRRPTRSGGGGGGGRGRNGIRLAGELMVTLGVVIMLFVVYEVYITDLFAAHKQAQATAALNQEWDTVGAQRTNHDNLTEGVGFAKMFIPSFGPDYFFTIVEGTEQSDLAIGPGHYTGSALPGEPGDFAVAGHRVGEGAPFDDLGLLQSCDSVVVETADDWYVYRVLPMANEVANWSTGAGRNPLCNGPDGEGGKVAPLTGLYAQTVGQEIVLPSESDVVAPVPHHPDVTLSSGQEIALMTMTTCNPKFSSTQRMIIHAVLVQDWKKNPAKPNFAPPELKETS